MTPAIEAPVRQSAFLDRVGSRRERLAFLNPIYTLSPPA
jgi:hypothetical protein